MKLLQGKTAFITGGTRGIGKAIALKLASEGANIAITYVKSTKAAEVVVAEIEGFGGKAIAVQADAFHAENVIEAVDRAVSQCGSIDILVNSAGIFELGPITELTLDDYDRSNSVNVRSVFAATMQAVKTMPEGGRIITIGSINADIAPFPGGSLYGMSKSAVKMMAKAWARDLGEKKITSNVIQPGPIDTDMNPADGAFGETLTGMTAIKRYGTADEVAELVLFLASDRANNITGASINIDGGLTV
ncbi:MAG: 3-oxoacyl-ACP reductase family protein [Pricia sp.]